MAGALGVVLTTDAPLEGRAAVPAYVDDSLPIVGPSRAVQVVTDGRLAGGPPIPIRLAPAGTPAIGPALPIYIVSGILDPLAYTNKVKAIAPNGLIAGYSFADPVGSAAARDESGNGRHGACTAITFGQPGIGDGRTSASFNGTSSVCNIYSAGLAGAFNGGEGTAIVWVPAAPNDGVVRTLLILQAVDSNNRILIDKPSGGGVRARYTAGGTAETFTVAPAPTDWTMYALTWSKTGDVARFYVGAGAPSEATGLGTWNGALVSTTANIGSSTAAGSVVWADRIAHAWLWGVALSAAQISQLATVNTW